MFHNAWFQNSTSGGGHLTTAPDSPVRHAELHTLNIPQDACVGSVLLSFSSLFFLFISCVSLFGFFRFELVFAPPSPYLPLASSTKTTFQTLVCKYAISVAGLVTWLFLLCHSSADLLPHFQSVNFCPLCLSRRTDRQPAVCLRVVARARLSITATSFCNYTLHCTQTRHQVGPEPTSAAPPALITVAF